MDLFIFVCHVCLCHTLLSVSCSLVVTCWERADLFAILCVMLSCVFVTFPYGVLGQMWYLIVSIPDICLLPYFDCNVYQMYVQVITNWPRPPQQTPNTWNFDKGRFLRLL